jgi:CRISPR-associated endonuclease/helicase Cas3
MSWTAPLSVDDFGEFFAAVHDGHKPFAWQERHLERLLTEGRYPEQVSAPTGTGKTALIDMHVFAVAAMAEGSGKPVPRRLAVVVPRRALVDDQYEHALGLARRLGPELAKQKPIVQRIADALSRLRWQQSPPLGAIGATSPLLVARLRGGLRPPRAWLDDPTTCAILNCTPDMWGSRLLGRGYGSSSTAWPREMGLLGIDAVVVIDEAHLNKQLITTARSVARLQALARPLGVPTLQVVATTATPSDEPETTSGVEAADLECDPVLAQRVNAQKDLTLAPTKDWLQATGKGGGNKKEVNAYRELLVAQATALRRKYGPTVIVFVNTVAMATKIAAILEKQKIDGKEAVVEIVCGRLREHDLAQLRQRRPGLLSLVGNSGVDFVVATQSLEVGVDMDGSAGVSELAPAGALAQRAGRVNRLGAREHASFVVMVPDDAGVFADKGAPPRVGPYEMTDLESAYQWLCNLKSGFSPWALANNPPPASQSERKLFQRVELADTWWWSRSSDSLDPDPGLDLWLSDDLKTDSDVAFVVRHHLPDDPEEAKEMLTCLPPQDHELFPTPIGLARRVLEKILGPNGTNMRYRDGKIGTLGEGDSDAIRPGDIIIVNDTAEIFHKKIVDEDGGEAMPDVLEDLENPGRGEVSLRVDKQSWPETAEAFLGACSEILAGAKLDSSQAHSAIAELICDTEKSKSNTGTDKPMSQPTRGAGTDKSMALHAADLLKGPVKDCAITARYDEDGDNLVRLMITDQRSAVSDDGARQTWTPKEDPPTLAQHSAAVANRGRHLANTVGLSEPVAVEEAGRHHDDGKDDQRFQDGRLGRKGGEPLAKGRKPLRGDKDTSGLPSGWRHEQLSVAHVYEKLPGLTADERNLILRLVGTSHGHGRAVFPHSSRNLGPPS